MVINMSNYIGDLNKEISIYLDIPVENLTDENIAEYFGKECLFYQIITRPHDRNGNGFTLVVAYMTKSYQISFSAYHSNANCRRMFKYCKQAVSIRVSASEYKAIKNSSILVVETI
jgi:hypothetical protein